MTTVYIILYILALISFIVAAAQSTGAVRLLAAGLAFWVTVPLIEAIRASG